MTRRRKRTMAELRAMHAQGMAAPVVGTIQRPVAAAMPVARAEARPAPAAEPVATLPPEAFGDTGSEQDFDILGDALVLLAMSNGGDDLSIQMAAREIAKRRSVPLAQALQIVRHAKLSMTAVGRTRKAMDPDTEAALIGETRVRLFAIFKLGMSKDNFGKGGAAAAMKAAQAIALLDGCPVDGMVQIVGKIKHEHEHRVQDPERAAIASEILARVRAPRVIDVEVAADG